MQAKLEEFNELYPKEVLAALEEAKVFELFEIADAQRMHWQNDAATLVLRYKREDAMGLSWAGGFELARLAAYHNADEIDHMHEDYQLYVRLWWD